MPKRKASPCESSVPSAEAIAPIFTRVKPSFVADAGEKKSWRILSWNVAGLRACVKKNDFEKILSESPDLIFLGETKCNEWPPLIETKFKDYKKTLVASQKGGYAGVGLLSKVAPIKVIQGIGDEEFDKEGRLIIAEYSHFFFIGVYVPNSGRGLVNLSKRERWEKIFLEKIQDLDKTKPVIYGGDLNVAHSEIDLRNPESNRNKTAGFTDQERGWFTDLLAAGFKDTFRTLHPDEKAYTYWSYIGSARENDVGWRLDYYVVSNRIMEKVKTSGIMRTVTGSDHCPVILDITF
ncbi:unnamed protein product [Caenorhabditis auriculariae]|uniref:exodeoxyribonuclease III n=1 Tax=Caenorhabditis auriculariae TaxID=2777116 RepID=A0A8S1GUK2_9PELO|nr:unnamed protein product [Caenorhabditis auriculariae]